jgi:transcriptional regulator with XRE-family HTH domain
MGKIEHGEHMPTLAMILRIANALGRTAGELLLETESVLTEQQNAGSSRRQRTVNPLVTGSNPVRPPTR